jgi:hypothetical protein
MLGNAKHQPRRSRAPPSSTGPALSAHMSGHPWPRTEGCPYLNSELRTVVQPKDSP